MSGLADSLKSFKRSLVSQPVYGVKRAAAVAFTANEQTASTLPIAGNAKVVLDGITDTKKKSKKANTVYSQPTNTGPGSHTMSQLYTIINYLKSAEDPQSIVAIKSRANIDISKNPDLLEKLSNNDKIDFDRINQTFAYKPTYQIKNKKDLLDLLNAKRDEGGMDMKDLKDSYQKLNDAVEELAGVGQILVFRNKDQTPRILFHNDATLNTPIDSEFKDMWGKITIPDETDLPRELEAAGLKTMEVFDKKVKADPKQKKSKARNRKVKITNTHLANIDLTVDFPVPKK